MGQNSDRNVVEDLTCSELKNDGSGGGVHCVYWSNGSDLNVVNGATCENATSSCFKLRDDSNQNDLLNLTCRNVEQCFFSGMPSSRREEKKDQRAKVRFAGLRNVGKTKSCVLKPGGNNNSGNCKKVITR